MSQPHVIVVGAGFAGLAARELENTGVKVDVYEARDRVGGRAWTEERMGRPLELGATWVHWYQSHIWREIERYGQKIVASPEPEHVAWSTSNGEVRTGSLEQVDELMDEPLTDIFARAEEYFPQPFEPEWIMSAAYDGPAELREQFYADDQKSVIDIVKASGKYSQEQIDLISAYWAAAYIGNPSTGSSLMAKQWLAMSVDVKGDAYEGLLERNAQDVAIVRLEQLYPLDQGEIDARPWPSGSPAVEALNRGAALAPCLHNTGEGGLAPAHQHGGELVGDG